MELKQVRIRLFNKEFIKIRRLLLSQLPKEERYSSAFLWFNTRRSDYDCTALFDGDTFVGFYYALLAEKMVFLLYIAVDPNLQSKGYGSAIQRILVNNYPGREITCHTEEPKDPASKTELAARRVRFYEKVGYAFTGYHVLFDGVLYWVMSTRGRDFDLATYEKLFSDKEGEKNIPKLEKV